MSQYKIVYLPSAQDDINNAIRYIAVNLANPTASEALLGIIEEKVKSLSSGHWRGQELKKHSSGIFVDIDMNWCSVKNYYLFFRFDEMEKRLRIFHFSHKLQGLHHILSEAEE